MLVLSRKATQTIVIAHHIIIKALKIEPQNVTLEVLAPNEVIIQPAELLNTVVDYSPPTQGEKEGDLTPTFLREQGQALLIGNDIKVQVENISGSLVRIGIEAPQEYDIARGENYERPDTPAFVLGDD